MKTIKLLNQNRTKDKIKYFLFDIQMAFLYRMSLENFTDFIKKKIRKNKLQTNRYKQAVEADRICAMIDCYTIAHMLYNDKYIKRIWNVNANYLEDESENLNI